MLTTAPPKNVAIVGAGLAGMSLALQLHKRCITCTIYELRQPTYMTDGAIMLSPNALRILDRLGVYQRVRAKGFEFDGITFKDEHEQTTGVYYLGHDKLYGYKALRLYRQILLDDLRKEVTDSGIPIVYGKRFSKIVEETEEGVTFQFEDGTTASADLLFGADGIHSTVRREAVSPLVPKFSGLVAITCALQKSSLGSDKQDYPLPASIQGKPGSWVMAPQNPEGEELLAGLQIPYPDQDRAGWAKFTADKDLQVELMRKDYEQWPPTVRAALDGVPKETVFTWPFYTLPKLDSWRSAGKRVALLGDAAHAVPPVTGQGANQAFEDSYTLALVLANTSEKIPLDIGLDFWNQKRQVRVDEIVKMTGQINNMRLPKAEREKLPPGSFSESDERGQLMWLYGKDVGKEFLEWIQSTQ
jgi:2-polyprenyl-6-methoxyphenol hydroxylase-like FAD-dependent oxidoreductase